MSEIQNLKVFVQTYKFIFNAKNFAKFQRSIFTDRLIVARLLMEI